MWRAGVVQQVGRQWSGAVELTVLVPEAIAPDTSGPQTVKAIAYPQLTGVPQPGDGVLLNVSALARGLGTGGYALVIAPGAPVRPDQLPADPAPGPGHLVKARYTPMQTMVLGVDDQESPHHEALQDADDIEGMPVVIADLHSALPAVIAGVRHGAARAGRRSPKVAYVMTDGGALPAWFSRTVAGLRETGWLNRCVTAGQAFGGDLEAVTVHTALLAARVVADADVAIVAQGPGNLGTGTRWGFSGVAAGEAVNAAAVLGGRPVASLRVSGADLRERHVGISHHSLTAYGRVAFATADVVVPDFSMWDDGSPEPLATLGQRIDQQVRALTAPEGRHRLVRVPAGPELLAALATSPVRLSTMGRGLDADPAAFLAAGAAGVYAAELLAP